MWTPLLGYSHSKRCAVNAASKECSCPDVALSFFLSLCFQTECRLHAAETSLCGINWPPCSWGLRELPSTLKDFQALPTSSGWCDFWFVFVVVFVAMTSDQLLLLPRSLLVRSCILSFFFAHSIRLFSDSLMDLLFFSFCQHLRH